MREQIGQGAQGIGLGEDANHLAIAHDNGGVVAASRHFAGHIDKPGIFGDGEGNGDHRFFDPEFVEVHAGQEFKHFHIGIGHDAHEFVAQQDGNVVDAMAAHQGIGIGQRLMHRDGVRMFRHIGRDFGRWFLHDRRIALFLARGSILLFLHLFFARTVKLEPFLALA